MRFDTCVGTRRCAKWQFCATDPAPQARRFFGFSPTKLTPPVSHPVPSDLITSCMGWVFRFALLTFSYTFTHPSAMRLSFIWTVEFSFFAPPNRSHPQLALSAKCDTLLFMTIKIYDFVFLLLGDPGPWTDGRGTINQVRRDFSSHSRCYFRAVRALRACVHTSGDGQAWICGLARRDGFFSFPFSSLRPSLLEMD